MNLLGPLEVMALPPRLAGRVLDDLHDLAEGVQRLTSRDGDLSALLQSVRVLPRVEDGLSARIEELRLEVRGLKEWLEPLHRELTDLDETAEGLEAALARLQLEVEPLRGQVDDLRGTVEGFRQELGELRDRIPGLRRRSRQ